MFVKKGVLSDLTFCWPGELSNKLTDLEVRAMFSCYLAQQLVSMSNELISVDCKSVMAYVQ